MGKTGGTNVIKHGSNTTSTFLIHYKLNPLKPSGNYMHHLLYQ
jgi:hypothetical protein